ncbi:BglG family transcriptional antiterminator [Oceanotoga teriensis]|uniref:BglG family transcriptional antiterminator n=1 Tax=Oceanotoga teriensis TaxID=515440 RepID=A0AA45C811_9BACT|nr:PRD domain-containing protein [Oceanotoga teriensis]PWJ95642.1 BglG family transcriptional antiterminator [Oceanotoga teriensis]
MNHGFFKVIKVVNNNVILALEMATNKEVMAIGKGVGFGKKTGEEHYYKPGIIEKTYISRNDEIGNEFYKLLNQIDMEIIGLSEEIIFHAEKKLGKLNSHIHIALTDHISFALERIKEGLIIENPFLFEIKTMYDDEYEIAEEVALVIRKRFNIDIPDSEKGYIALHLNSARQSKDIKETLKDTKVIKGIIEILNEELNMKIQEDKLSYSRLLTHLKYVINISTENNELQNPLLSDIKKEFKNSFKIAKKVADYLKKKLNVVLNENELGYLALHLERIKKFKN